MHVHGRGYETVHTAAEGVRLVYGFLGDWFPRKALWASPSAVKSLSASFKKFYTFMNGRGLVSDRNLEILKYEIKGRLPDWMAGAEM